LSFRRGFGSCFSFRVSLIKKEKEATMTTRTPQQNSSLSLPALNRRHLLVGSASALASVGLSTWSGVAVAQVKPLPPYVA
jgi:hypothetical protein